MGDNFIYLIDSIGKMDSSVTFLPAPLRAQPCTIAHNSEPLDSLKPVHPMGAPRITPTLRFGTRTDREQHIEDKIYSVEEKSR